MRIFMHNNQNGMVLVLAMFMMALLSMIGIASMMTTTTDIEIATGEKQYIETFYRAQSSHVIAGELLLRAKWDRGLDSETTIDADGNEIVNSFETYDPDGNPVDFKDIDDYTFAFRLTDPDVTQEGFENVSKITPTGKQIKVWQVDEQDVDELPCPQDMSASECKALDTTIGEDDTGLWTDLRLVRIQDGQEIVLADIDIDKIASKPMPGAGAKFGADDFGMGDSAHIISYNLDARARLSSGNFNKSPSRQAMGFRVID